MADTNIEHVAESAEQSTDASGGRFGLLLALGIGAGIALGIIGAIVWNGRSDDPALSDVEPGGTVVSADASSAPSVSVDLDPDAQLEIAAQFLNAWRTSRSVAAVVSYEERRERDGGSTISAAGMLVQAPPQRLESTFGSVEGILDGAPATCEQSLEGPRECRRSTTGSGDFAAQINAEVDNLRLLFTSTPATYRVLHDAQGCYSLTLLVEVGGPPFGRMATVCFDDDVGVLSRLEITFAGGVVETKTATSIRPSATAADFEAILRL